MKTVLVTGGNRGIGLEICRQLTELGHRVIMGSRNTASGQKAAAQYCPGVIVRQLDVTSEESIGAIYDYVSREYGRLDVLINNAGAIESSFGAETSKLSRTKEFIEQNIPGAKFLKETFVRPLKKAGIIPTKFSVSDIPMDLAHRVSEVNLYGPWRMIRAFIPLLHKSNDARIINISSGMGELGSLAGDHAAYRISKVSLNALTIMFARELHSIRVNAMCPGWVRTEMGGPNAPRDVSQGADTAVWLATEKNIPTGKFFRDRKEINW